MNKPLSRKHLYKVVLLGVFIALLIFLFHPATGQLSLIINGEPVAEPLTRLAAIPTLLIVLAATVFLGVLLFIGAGFIIFSSALMFAVFGLILVAPYFWPMLIIILLVIALSSFSDGNQR